MDTGIVKRKPGRPLLNRLESPPVRIRGDGNPIGRPLGSKSPNTIEADKLREFAIEKVRAHAEPLIEAKLALALGHYKIVEDKEGKQVIGYTVSPDGNAIQYLLNQAIGKPKETVELDTTMTLKVDF